MQAMIWKEFPTQWLSQSRWFHTPAIGLDWGYLSSKSARIVRTKQEWKLLAFGWAPARSVLQLLREVGYTPGRRWGVSFPGRDLFCRQVELDAGSRKDLRETLLLQLEQTVPYLGQDFLLDYQILDQLPGTEKVQALVVAVPQQSYMEWKHALLRALGTERVGPRPTLVYPELLAHGATLALNDPAFKYRNTVLVDLGAAGLRLHVYLKGSPVASFYHAVSGMRLTEEIAADQGLDLLAAEELKCRALFSGESRRVAELIYLYGEDVVGAIRESFRQCALRGMPAMDTIVLTGGGGQIPFLTGEITQMLDCETVVLDPFKNLTWDQGVLSEDFLQRARWFSSVAVGVALRLGGYV